MARYSLKISRTEDMDSVANNTALDLEAKAYRTINGAVRSARWAVKHYGATSRVFDGQGSLVLVVDDRGSRAP